MSAPTGWVGLTLNGFPFANAMQAPGIRRTEIKSVLQGGPGGRREHLPWMPAGYAVRVHKLQLMVNWKNIGNKAHRLESILAGPGPFQACAWKRIHLSYVGDGSRSEFFLPDERPVATDTLTTPPQGALASFFPIVQLGVSGAALTYAKVDLVDYEAAPPEVGTVHFLNGGTRFRLAAAPSAGTNIVVAYVPLLSVVEAETSEKRYPDPVSEPRALELVEL